MPPLPTAPDPDAELVARARGGDQEAVTELYRRHSQRGYNLALRMTGDPWDAADATQEAFIKAFTHLGSFKGQARFSTWLYRIVVNSVNDQLRRRRPAPVEDEVLDLLTAQPSGPGSTRVGASAAQVEDKLSPEMKAALAALPEGFRLAVVLCDLLGYAYAEAAEILEVQEGTIKSRVFRARAQLAASLREMGFAPDDDGNRGPTRTVSSNETNETGHGLPSQVRYDDRLEKHQNDN